MLEKQAQNKNQSRSSGIKLRDFVLIFGLVLSIFNTIILLWPVGAKLTVFIDNTGWTYVSGRNDFDLNVYVKVVNDSPKTAFIRGWRLELDFKVNYTILRSSESHAALMLSPSSQTEITFSRTITGENNTTISSNDLQKIKVEISYEDDLGSHTALREYNYAH
jgi:hypothetical protein